MREEELAQGAKVSEEWTNSGKRGLLRKEGFTHLKETLISSGVSSRQKLTQGLDQTYFPLTELEIHLLKKELSCMLIFDIHSLVSLLCRRNI
jgi:hypothetical protein